MRAAELGEEITATPWEWEPRPDVWLLVLCVAAAYWWATTRLRARLVGQPAALGGAVAAAREGGLQVARLLLVDH